MAVTFGMLLLLLILGSLGFMIAGIVWGYGWGSRSVGRAESRPDVRWGLRAAAGLALVILAVYGWWAISFPFWGEDDQFIACAKEYGLHCLRAAIGYGPMSWRPLQRLSVLTDFVFWGESILGKNLQNLLLFVASALSVSLFAYQLFADRGLAVWAGVVFSLFPAHVSVVTRIDQRGNSLCLIFSLLALTFFLKYWDARRLVWLAVASSASLLALLSKETGFLLPAWAALILLVRLKTGLRLNQDVILSALAFGLPWIGVLVMRAYHYNFEVWLPTGTVNAWNFIPTLGTYVSELVFPFLHRILPVKILLSFLVVLWIAWEVWKNGLFRDWRYLALALLTLLTVIQFAYVAPVDIRLGFLLNRLYIVMGFFAIFLTALLRPGHARGETARLAASRPIALVILLAGYVAQLMVNRVLILHLK